MSLLIKGVGGISSLTLKIPAKIVLIGDGRPAIGVIYLYTAEPFGDGVNVNFEKWDKLNEKAYITKADGTPLYYYIEGDETLTKIYVYPLDNAEEDLVIVLNDVKGSGMRTRYYDPSIFEKISPFSSAHGGWGIPVKTVPLWELRGFNRGWGENVTTVELWVMTPSSSAWGDNIAVTG